MRSTIRPDELSKYAPRWVREGKTKPQRGKGLPPATQLPPIEATEPVWRGPSPFQDDVVGFEHGEANPDARFDGDVRHWRDYQAAEPQLTHQLPLPLQGSMPMDFTGRLFKGTALLTFAVAAIGALGLVLFPDAPKQVAQLGDRVAAVGAERAVSQYDKHPIAKSTARLVAEERPAQTSSRPAGILTVAQQAAVVSAAAPVATAQSASASPQQSTVLQPQPAAPAANQVQAANQVPAANQAPAVADAANVPAPTPQSSAMPPAAASAVSPLTPQRVHSQRILNPDELDRLIKRGEAFLDQGDVAAARLVFLRAAEARDPRAALALGSTYDPNALKKMGVVGVSADAEQARSWYERAADFGSGDAAPRLSALAQLGR